MKMGISNSNNSNHNNNHHPHSNRIVHGNYLELAQTVANKGLIEPGSHNLLIYNDLKKFREIYSQSARASLAENEIVVIATQYDPIEEVKNTLRLAGVEIESYLNQGSLFILDAQQGYQGEDSKGTWRFAMSLLSRAKKEGILGVTWFGDLGSFFNFEKVEELMQYELWCPQKYEDNMKTVCCYHSDDFENLNENQKQTLFDHHLKSIVVE